MSRKQWATRRDTDPTIKETNGFETDLTQKQKFYLYFYPLCPSIDIIHTFWRLYNEYNKQVERYRREMIRKAVFPD